MAEVSEDVARLAALLDRGAEAAERCISDSRRIDYAHLQGAIKMRELIDEFAKRDPFDGNRGTGNSGTAPA